MKNIFNPHKLSFKILNSLALNSILFMVISPTLNAFEIKYQSSSEQLITKSFLQHKYNEEINDKTDFDDVSGLEEKKQFNTNQVLSSVKASAKTAGAGQSESASFSINSHDGIINKFTGDLNYSIPIMDVDGFPLTLTYNPNISMDQEASWVGLGWDLSLGSISRDMRGIPDDFNGDEVSRTYKALDLSVDGKKNGVSVLAGVGIDGTKVTHNGATLSQLGVSGSSRTLWGKYFNSYNGVGYTKDRNTGLGVSFFGVGLNGTVGYNSDTQNGIGISSSWSLNLNPTVMSSSLGGVSFGKSTSINTRSGIKNQSNHRTISAGVKLMGSGTIVSFSKGSFISFGKETYVPKYNNNSFTTGDEITNSVFLTGIYNLVWASLGYTNVKYDNVTSFNNINSTLNAYGYLNYSNSINNTDNAMLDFNRDGANAPSQQSKYLNFSQPTYDLFYCNAPGISSNFRGFRYDVPNLHDPKRKNISTIDDKSNEIGATGGQITEEVPPVTTTVVGINFGKSYGATSVMTLTGKGNDSQSLLGFLDPSNPNQNTFDNKEYYFKSLGEVTPNDDRLQLYGGKEPVYLGLDLSNNENIILNGLLTNNDNASLSIPATNPMQKRKDNVVHYREYKGDELSMNRIKVKSFPLVENVDLNLLSNFTLVNNFTEGKKGHHIQAVEVVNENGMRYVFGIPNYSYLEKNVTFSIEKTPTNAQNAEVKNIISYEDGDNSINNSKGRQQVYENQIIPAYAHSFLLTEMYSSDYVDLKKDGPTKDDIGNYYKINYSNVYKRNNGTGAFAWRLPLSTGTSTTGDVEKQKNLAYYYENLESDPWDDMAQYIYGEKELWYGQSIESKNMVAFFKLEKRNDMVSVTENTGAMDTQKKGYYLKKIELYVKSDLELNPTTAKPVQVVEFDYDYSLCKNYPGNIDFVNGVNSQNNGKLTLKRIYFYTGTSKKNKTTPYVFNYSTNNPNFAFNSSDRWGNYKPNDPNFTNHKYPYSVQDETIANANVQAWKLISVNQPEGSKIEFEFEVDTYSHVEDKRAMRMFSMLALGDNDDLNALNTIQNVSESHILNETTKHLRNVDDKKNPYEIIFFKLDQAIENTSISQAQLKVINEYFKAADNSIMDQILVNLSVDLGNQNNGLLKGIYDNIEVLVGIAKINGSIQVGVVGSPSSSTFGYGYIAMKTEKIDQVFDKAIRKISNLTNIEFPTYDISPLQIASWQFARVNAPYLIYGAVDYDATSAQNFSQYTTSIDRNAIFGGELYNTINTRGYGLHFNPEKSLIRLFEPDNSKIGGNFRISAITYKNNWDQVSLETGATYRWEYNYTGERQPNGVSSFEPISGKQENPLYQLEGYSLERYLVPDERVHNYLPVCEMLYPTPIVGYPQVEYLFSPSTIDYSRGVGKGVEYYKTAKDFPLLVKYTSKPNKINKLEDDAIQDGAYRFEFLGLSQGFSVETNDMHGKLYKTELFDAGTNLISSNEYVYADLNTQSISYLKEDGSIFKDYPPRDVDMYVDSWQNVTAYEGVTDGFSTALTAYILPSAPPIIIPDSDPYTNNIYYSKQIKGFTFTKHIHHTGVVLSVKSFNLGSANSAENMLYDYRSGEVLLSSLKDEFNDKLYSFSYPAHWKHRSFLNMNQMDGTIFTPEASGDFFQVPAGSSFRFTQGDYIIIQQQQSISYAWVLETDESFKKAYLIDNSGNHIDPSSYNVLNFKIFRTGRKNRLTENMMSVVTKQNPISPDGNSCILALPRPFVDPSLRKDEEILNVSAVIYSDQFNLPCPELNGVKPVYSLIDPTQTSFIAVNDKINPFLYGAKGNYQVVKQLAFQSGRKDVVLNSQEQGIREDGIIENYIPFYASNSNETLDFQRWYGINEPGHPNYTPNLGKWRELGQIESYDEQQMPIQSSNQISVSSAHLKSLNEKQYVIQEAQAVNAKYHEIGFEGFEATSPIGVSNDNGFNLHEMLTNSSYGQLVTYERHSGLQSLSVLGSVKASFPTYQNNTCNDPNIVNNEYFVRSCDCIPNFALENRKSYFFSVWVKVNPNFVNTPSAAYVKIKFNISDGSIVEIPFYPSGAIIDGWQKIEGEYSVHQFATSVEFEFGSNTPTYLAYFDDFRTHPFLAGMQTVVYDQKTLLPLATHDGYNFTTFYNYDENYNLVRVKVETTEGIKTISEQEIGTYRQN